MDKEKKGKLMIAKTYNSPSTLDTKLDAESASSKRIESRWQNPEGNKS
jgi:hypothetical protein